MKGPLRHYREWTRTTRAPQMAFANASHVTWRREFPVTEVSVPAARDWARSLLSVGGPPPFLDDALLLLSEVVTNALTHSDSGRTRSGRVTVQITRTGTTVHVGVTDAGSSTTAPTVRAPTLDDDGGRGLWLVELLAEEWGSCHDETGRMVWFRLAD